ncbi:MAG: hypothetical protein GKR94_22625 [Gammaproteobacteria bacterium]|nr:hypothetical protein [Gammaproteobacteria bacterium]
MPKQQSELRHSALQQRGLDEAVRTWTPGSEDSDDLSILKSQGLNQRHSLLQWNQRLAWVAFIAIVGLIAHQSATATWALLGYRPEQPLALLETPVTMPSEQRRNRINVDEIVDAHLFGIIPPQAIKEEAPPDTDLELLLKGIVFSDVLADARAIIAVPGGIHGAYAIGSYVPGDARILEIRHTLVVIERDGRRETLRLEAKRKRQRSDDHSNAQGLPPHRRIDKRSDYQLAKILGRFQTRLQTDPASAMSLLRIAPERNGEHLLGIRIYPGPERGFLERIELQPDDLITHINGTAINSAARGLEALRALAAEREISLRVLRGKRRLALSFRVAQ